MVTTSHLWFFVRCHTHKIVLSSKCGTLKRKNEQRQHTRKKKLVVGTTMAPKVVGKRYREGDGTHIHGDNVSHLWCFVRCHTRKMVLSSKCGTLEKEWTKTTYKKKLVVGTMAPKVVGKRYHEGDGTHIHDDNVPFVVFVMCHTHMIVLSSKCGTLKRKNEQKQHTRKKKNLWEHTRKNLSKYGIFSVHTI